MTITALTTVAPITPVDRTASLQEAAPARFKADQPQRAPFDPLPALRPTIQDKIAIDRALITLRQL